MQEEIIKELLKNKNKLPQWIVQGEIINMIKCKYDISSESSICKALASMRKYEEIPFKIIINPLDLKKIHREDLIDKKICRRLTFAYKIEFN